MLNYQKAKYEAAIRDSSTKAQLARALANLEACRKSLTREWLAMFRREMLGVGR